MPGCGSASTSPTTAPTSTAGPPSRGCGPSRGCWRPRWPPCCGCPPSTLTCAGRTDAGVHARGQVVHLDVDELPEGAERLARRANGVLPPDVRVRSAAVAPDGFDARFSALWRRYAYRVADRPATVDPLRRAHVLTWGRPLDEAADERRLPWRWWASTTSRRSASSARAPPRSAPCSTCCGRATPTGCWSRTSGRTRSATAWCARWSAAWSRSARGGARSSGPASVLAAAVRDPAVAVAPAHGLTLEEVGYPPDAELGARVEITRARRG